LSSEQSGGFHGSTEPTSIFCKGAREKVFRYNEYYAYRVHLPENHVAPTADETVFRTLKSIRPNTPWHDVVRHYLYPVGFAFVVLDAKSVKDPTFLKFLLISNTLRQEVLQRMDNRTSLEVLSESVADQYQVYEEDVFPDNTADLTGGDNLHGDYLRAICVEGVTPTRLLTETTLLSDLLGSDGEGPASVLDPYVASNLLRTLKVVDVADDDMFLCPSTSQGVKKAFPLVDFDQVGVEEFGQAVKVLVDSANYYGAKKAFDLNCPLKPRFYPRDLKAKVFSSKEINNLPPGQAQAIRAAMENQIQQAVAISNHYLKNSSSLLIQGVPTILVGGRVHNDVAFSGLAEAFQEVFERRKKELEYKGKHISENSWKKILGVLDRFRDISSELIKLNKLMADYQRRTDGSGKVVEDVTQLVEKSSQLLSTQSKYVVRLNNIYSTLKDILSNAQD